MRLVMEGGGAEVEERGWQYRGEEGTDECELVAGRAT